MYESIKYEVTPPINETNRLNYFQNLHSNHEPLSSDQQSCQRITKTRRHPDAITTTRLPLTEAEILSVVEKKKKERKKEQQKCIFG